MTARKTSLVLAAALCFAGPARAQTAPDVDALKRLAMAEVEKRQTLVQQIVDQLFSYSELGFQEVETARYLTGLLEKNGFKVELCGSATTSSLARSIRRASIKSCSNQPTSWTL